jgi:pimeloyl-ACP methyl ester carboxylesterase
VVRDALTMGPRREEDTATPHTRPPSDAGDIATVMDAVGLPRAQIFAAGSTAPGAVVFAATHPDRVDGLVLLCPFLSGPLADDPDLTGWEPGAARRWAEGWLDSADRWGSGSVVEAWDPAIASPRVYRQAALLERTVASPSVARAYIEAARGPTYRVSPLMCSARCGFCTCRPIRCPRR